MTHLPRPGEFIERRYRLGNVIDTGGMGVIMRAEQLQAGREVAVKLLHPHIAAEKDFAERFKREVQVATMFDHANIITVYDVGETPDGVLYLVMELLEGEELRELIGRESPLSIAKAGDLALQMLDGLAEAHAADVVHRDLKPSNVFVTETRRGDPRVKLLDFGLAKVVTAQKTELTATGQITGTPSYMAPETLLQSVQPNEKAVDVYAAGLVLLEMLTGRRCFQADGMARTLLMQLKQPVFIPQALVDTPLGEVIRRSTAKHPDDRYADADAMYEELNAALKQSPGEMRLSADVTPEIDPDLTPGLLQQLAARELEHDLELLRQAPQTEIYESGIADQPTAVETRPDDDSPVVLSETEDFDFDDEPSSPGAETMTETALVSSSPGDSNDTLPSDPFAALQTQFSQSGSRRRIGWVVGAAALLVAAAGLWVGLDPLGEKTYRPTDSSPSGADNGNKSAATPASSTSPSPQRRAGPDRAGEIDTVADRPNSEDRHLEREQYRITTSPPGARVSKDGELLGETEVIIPVDADGLPESLSVDKRGYRKRKVTIDRNSPSHLEVVLERKPQERPSGTAGTTNHSGSGPPTQPSPEPESEGPSGSPAAPDPRPADRSGGSNANDDTSDKIDQMVDQYLPEE